MAPSSPRILVGQLFQETHGFTPLTTPLSAFEIESGSEMLLANLHADSVLGGFLKEFQEKGCQVLPSIAARARPGGRVEDAAYTFIKNQMLAAVRQGGFDAIALCLHGCTQTESLDSAETDLLAELRAIVGTEMPIVAGFDLHAHSVPEVIGQLTFSSAYKTNPHSDALATGRRVARELLKVLSGGAQPAAAYVHVPMLTRGNDETAHGPLFELHTRARTAVADSHGQLIDYSIYNVNPFIDGTGVGQSVVVYSQTDAREQASALAANLAQALWNERDEYVHSLPSVDEILSSFEPGVERITIGDFGDRVLAGGPGDSLYVLDRALSLTSGRVAAVVTDPFAYEACAQAGPGANIELPVGGRYTTVCKPFVVSGTIVTVGTGTYTNRGVFMRGSTMRLGDYAVIRHPRYDLLITRDAIMSQDPGCYLDAGVDLEKADIIIAKSGYHFKLAFDTWGSCVCAETPGLTGYHPQQLPFETARPFYPLDDMPFTPRVLNLR